MMTGEFRQHELATYRSGIYCTDLAKTGIVLGNWYEHPAVLDDDGKAIPFLLEAWDGNAADIKAREFMISLHEIPSPRGGDRETRRKYDEICELLKGLIKAS